MSPDEWGWGVLYVHMGYVDPEPCEADARATVWGHSPDDVQVVRRTDDGWVPA